MFKKILKKTKKITSILTILLILFQNVAPLFLVATPVFAQTSVKNLNLTFDQARHELVMSGSADVATDFLLEYDDDDATTPADALQGQVNADSFEKRIYVGTCSTGECQADPISRGKLKFPKTGTEASFVINNDGLWLSQGTVATLTEVELNKTYVAPQNDQVSVTFTKLPAQAGSLSIEEIQLTSEQVEQLGATSNVAYDITSDMEDGSFAYNLTLPVPENIEEVEVKFAESVPELPQASVVAQTEFTDNLITAQGLDHFTVFVVTFETPQQPTPAEPGYNDLWFDWGGAVNRVPSGTDGIVSANGSFHAKVTGSTMTRWGGYKSIFPARGYDTAIDVYLDMNLAQVGIDKRFDFSSAINNPAGVHRRDFIINLGTNPAVAGHWLASASTNAPGWPGDPTKSPVNITESGWYTIKHEFRANSGNVLEVTVSLTKKGEATPIGSWVLSDASDIIGSTVGGNRYGWFTKQRFDFDWLAIDNSMIDDRVDAVAPLISVISPTQNSYSGKYLNISGDVSDADTGVKSVALNMYKVNADDSRTLLVGCTSLPGIVVGNTWSVTINSASSCHLGEGKHEIAAWAFDNANNPGWAQRKQFYVDLTAPAMSNIKMFVNESEKSLAKSGDTVSVRAIVEDPAGIDKVQIWVREYPWSPNMNELSSGNMTNISGDTWEFVFTVPTTYQDGDPINEGINGNYFNFRPYDSLSNSLIGWRQNFTVDNTKPAIPTGLKWVGSDGKDYQCNDYSLRQSHVPVWDDNTTDQDFDHYEYSSFHPTGAQGINEQVLNVAKFQNSWMPPTDGAYGFAVRAVDQAGNKSAWARTAESLDGSCQISYDSTPPTTPVVTGFLNPTLSCGDTTNLHNTTTKWSEATDNGSGVASYQYNVEYPLPNGGRGVWSPTLTGTQYSGSLNEGVHHITVKAIDNLGNESGWSNTCDITADWTAPTTTLTTPVGNFVTHTGINVNGSSNDLNGVADVKIFFSQAGQNIWQEIVTLYNTGTTPFSFDYTWTPEQDGIYDLKVSATDIVGNIEQSAYARGITYDTTRPTSTITSYQLADGGEIQTSTFSGLIEGTAADNLSGINHVLLSISHLDFGATESGTTYWDATASAWTNTESMFRADGTANWHYQLTNVPNGIFNLTSHAVDNADNVENTYRITIVYDQTIPQVNLAVNPATPDGDNGWYRFIKPLITLTANDNYQVDRIEYQWNGTSGAWTPYASPFNPPAEGQNILYYQAIDRVGNHSSLGVKEIKYDTTTPAGNPLNLKVENITSNTADASWTAPQPDTDVAFYRLSWKHEDGNSHGAETGRDDFKHQLTGLYNGAWTLYVKAMDAAGNFTETQVKFRVGPEPARGGTGLNSGTVLGATTTQTTGSDTGTAGTGDIYSDADATDEESTPASNRSTKDQPAQTGTVLGDSIDCSGWLYYLPFILLGAQLLLVLGFELFHREAGLIKPIVAVGLTTVMALLYYWINNPDCYAAGTILAQIDRWFVVLAGLTGLAGRVIGKFMIEE